MLVLVLDREQVQVMEPDQVMDTVLVQVQDLESVQDLAQVIKLFSTFRRQQSINNISYVS